MAFSSQVDLPLGESPQTSDAKIFPDLLDIYNSIHILQQYTDQVIKSLTSGDSSQKPWEAIPYTRWFYELVLNDVEIGTIVSCDGLLGGYVLGVPATTAPLNYWTPTNGNGFVGVCLEKQSAGSICKIGVGPAVIKAEGVKFGDMLFCQQRGVTAQEHDHGTPSIDLPSDGKIYLYQVSQTALVIGAGIAKDAALIYPFVDKFSTDVVNYTFDDSGNSGSGGS